MNRIVFHAALLILLTIFPSVSTFAVGRDLMSYQAEFFTTMPYRRNHANLHCYGLGGSAIFKIKDHFFAKTGLLFDLGKYKYNEKGFKYANGTIMEIGVPVMAEAYIGGRSNLNGLYFDLGVVPMYYNRLKGEQYTQKLPEIWVQKVEATKWGFPIESEKASGFSLVPKFEAGAYVSVGDVVVRCGVFAQYIRNLSKTESGKDMYKPMSHGQFGATVGLVF